MRYSRRKKSLPTKRRFKLKKPSTRSRKKSNKSKKSVKDLKRYIDNNMIKRDKYINRQSSFNGGDDEMMALDYQKKINNYSRLLKEMGIIYPVNDTVGEKLMAENP